MNTTPDQLLGRLQALGIAAETVEHPPVFTVDDNKALRGELPGAHAKNLFLKDKKGQLWLVVAAEDKPVDLKALKKVIGSAHLSFGRPELLEEVLGIAPGAVSPLALINDIEQRVTLVLDADLMAAERLNFHPMTNTATTGLSPDGLRTFVAACGHTVREVTI